MLIIIAIIAHEENGVLPCSSVFIIGVCNGFIHQHLSLVFRSDGESTYCHIKFIHPQRLGTFAIIKHCKEAIVYIATSSVERLFTFEAE